MSPDLVALALWHGATREMLALAATLIAVSSLDDLIVDALYIVRRLWRRAAVYSRFARADAAALPVAAGPFAIMVPAWDEAAVIGAMLRDLTRRLDGDYRVFVGAYPNDAATQAAVRGVGDPRIVLAVGTHDGPTTKADCLNHVWRAVLADEAAAGRRFKALVLHDAEDVVDALELRVFDHLIPRLAMVQLPVLPLPDATSRWVAGHYLDEFAESHAKDLVVREALGAAVPSAGVACAIERGIFGRIAADAGDAPFDPACLTEDYELGLRVKALGGRTALVRIEGPAGTVATREHFPATLDTALRQKTRWLLGIALGGWDRVGWPGGLADRVMLLRDRKAIVAALVTALGYLALLMTAIDLALAASVPAMAGFAPLVPDGGWLQAVLRFTTAVLAWRLVMRFVFTTRAAGWREGLRSVPRVVVGNLINALAAWRAAGKYTAIRRGRAAMTWDKTAHRFPGPP